MPIPHDRIDPYWTWILQPGGLRGLGTSQRRIPILVECQDAAQAAQLENALHQLPTPPGRASTLVVPASGSRFLTVLADRDTVTDPSSSLIALLKVQPRWELGLPFHSSEIAPDAPVAPADETPLPAAPGPAVRTTLRPLIGIIDYGCAFAHAQFRGQGGDPRFTRFHAVWDQGAEEGAIARATQAARASGLRPLRWHGADAGYGAVAYRADGPPGPGQAAGAPAGLDAFARQFAASGVLDEARCYALSGYRAIQTPYTHGTFIADLAAGVPAPDLVRPHAIGQASSDPAADQALLAHDLVFVQLPRVFDGVPVSGLLRTYVLDAVRFILGCAERADQPVLINLSYGANTGPHDGQAPIEQALDEVLSLERARGRFIELLVPAGNMRLRSTHATRVVAPGDAVTLAWANTPDNPTLQFTEWWFDGADADLDQAMLRVTPPHPGAATAEVGLGLPSACVDLLRGTEVVGRLIHHRRVPQGDAGRLVLMGVHPTDPDFGAGVAPYGRWSVTIANGGNAPIRVHGWIERDDPVFGTGHGPRQAVFATGLAPAEDPDAQTGLPREDLRTTLNSLGHGALTRVVGAQETDGRVAFYSGEEPGRAGGGARPGSLILARADDSGARQGAVASGVTAGARIRLPGTSVATALATRFAAARGPGWTTDLLVPPPGAVPRAAHDRVP